MHVVVDNNDAFFWSEGDRVKAREDSRNRLELPSRSSHINNVVEANINALF